MSIVFDMDSLCAWFTRESNNFGSGEILRPPTRF